MIRHHLPTHPRPAYGNPRFFLLAALASLAGCNGAPSRNILGSYFPSWMVCALVGIAVAAIARVILKSTGLLQELPAPFVVILAIGCAATFALWLLWLA
jgi:YtcA family